MEQLNFITNILGINDKNIIILDYLDTGTHKEVIAKLDYPASKCLNCQGQMAKYDFQEESPDRNHRQTENHSKIDWESPYDSYLRKFICLHFDSHSSVT